MTTHALLLASLILASLVLSGATLDSGEVDAECRVDIRKIPLETCLGEGEVFLYQSDDPYEDSANVRFTPHYDRLLIMTRYTTGDDFWLYQDGELVEHELVDDSGDPIHARVYEAEVEPGEQVRFVTVRTVSDHQGFLVYDSEEPLYTTGLWSVFDDDLTESIYLDEGEHSLVLFDKYSEHRSGATDDRSVTISLSGDELATYNQPWPGSIEGAIVAPIEAESAGAYDLTIDSRDSIYWYGFTCEPGPYCGDSIVNQESEECDGTDGVGEHESCSETCELVDLTYCGDGVKQTPNDEGTGGPEDDGYEECDGADGVGEHESCSASCELVEQAYCGDGIVNQLSEQCDGTQGVGEHQMCNEACELEELTYCGDDVKQTPNDEGTGGPEDDGYEACDGSDGVGEYQECTATCELNDLTYCGDGVVQRPNDVGTGGPEDDGYEECDGSAPEGYSCSGSCELIEDSCTLPDVKHRFAGPVYENTSVYIDTVSRIVIELEENVSAECFDQTIVEYDATLVEDEYCQNAQLCAESEHDVSWSEYTGPFGLDEEGCYAIDYRSRDSDENETRRTCVFHDESPPELEKSVGEPKEPWDGANAYYPEAEEWCWSTEDGPECYTLAIGTPIELSCLENGAEQSGVSTLCFEVGLDGDDATEAYCESADGELIEGSCCLETDEYTLYFEEESWHKLSYTCTDNVNKSALDVEYFKVEDGSFEIELNKKWNLISVPVRLLDEDMAAVFDEGSVISVWGFDGEWSVYTPDGVDNDDLNQMIPGYGYWVLTNESSTLTIGGGLLGPIVTPPSIEVSEGWNLLGYYGTEGRSGYYGPERAHGAYAQEGDSVRCHLNSLQSSIADEDTVSVFSYWEPFNPQPWNTHRDEMGLRLTDRMDPGAGYWVQAFDSATYTPTSTCDGGEFFD